MLRNLVFALSCLVFSGVRAQGVDSMMKIYADELPQQKIHVHFDKGVHRAGETLWFKAYLFAGYQPAINSNNLFTELIGNDGVILQRKVYPLFQSSVSGGFDLPDSTPPGHLVFRAYTTWMLNFDTAFIFQRNITIVGKAGSIAPKAAAPTTTKFGLQFFPEGGNLVNEVESVIAFKANDSYGNPVSVTGNIVNSVGEKVQVFTSEHDGMGVVNFTPRAGQSYKALWKDPAGTEQSTPLPQANAEGVVLKISQAGSKKIFILKRSEGVPQNQKTIIIEAHLAQELVYKAKVPLVNTLINSGSINVANLPAGILQITAFSENWEPLAERIVMVNNDNYSFKADIKAMETNTAIRAKNVLEIQMEDTSLSNMSVSITDAAIDNTKTNDNIISRLLLTGDIKGYVNNPAYYFSNKADSTAGHLDLVLLTNGWRRYKWDDIANNRRPRLKFPNDPLLALSAKVFGITSLNPLRRDEELIAIVSNKDSSTQLLQLPKAGPDVFSLPNQIYFDTISISYQFNKDKSLDRNAALKFDNGFYKGYSKINQNGLPYYFAAEKDSVLLNRSKFLAQQISKFGSSSPATGNVLQGVTVKTKVKSRLEELDEKYSSGLFKGDAYTFDMSENFSMDIFTYLRGRVPGLQINNNGSDVSLTWRGSTTSVFLDEIQAQPDQLSSLSPADIAYIKVFRPPFFGAIGGGGGGAIAVYTRKGSDVKTVPGKGLSRTQLIGYASPKEFYSPDYTLRSASADVIADYRSTLYWNGNIFMDGTRPTTKIQFFNNDATKSFRVVLEGVNELGKLIRIEKVLP